MVGNTLRSPALGTALYGESRHSPVISKAIGTLAQGLGLVGALAMVAIQVDLAPLQPLAIAGVLLFVIVVVFGFRLARDG